MSAGAPSFDDPRDKNKSRDPLVGTVLDDRFQIDDVLGSGGMSVVYLATQIRVNRQVAIKTLKMQLDTKEVYRERFHREITLLCALSHPHIVTVYDCVFDDEHQPYVVMDYLRGRSLEALIKEEGAINLDRFARIVVQVCSALEYAHKNGVIHRDLKPGNLVLMDDEMDFVKVVDFGLAKLNQENRKLTQSGELWGSPPYLSPEQCIGKPEDARSDIYSLGCVMYEMLTGKDPFHDGTSIYELIQYHVNTPPPSMHSIKPDLNLPSGLESVIFKAMAKAPEDRYQTAQELSTAIVKACAESHSQSGNLKIMSGNSSGGLSAQPNAVSVGLAANNFNLALDPMAGMSVEDAFLDRGVRKGTDNGGPDPAVDKKTPPTRQMARDRFSNMEVEPEQKKSGAGKLLIGGFVAVVICAVALFAAVSMRTAKTETTTTQTNIPNTTAKSAGSQTTAAQEPATTSSPDTSSASVQATSKVPDQVVSSPPKQTAKADSAQNSQPVRVQPTARPRVKPKVRAATQPKRIAPPKPAGSSAGKKHDPWHDLGGMRSN